MWKPGSVAGERRCPAESRTAETFIGSSTGSNSKQFSLLYQPAGKLPTCVADPVLVALGELAQRSDGYHRVPLTDALIAAAAAEHGAIAVLHRDTHFDKLSEVLKFENVELPES